VWKRRRSKPNEAHRPARPKINRKKDVSSQDPNQTLDERPKVCEKTIPSEAGAEGRKAVKSNSPVSERGKRKRTMATRRQAMNAETTKRKEKRTAAVMTGVQ